MWTGEGELSLKTLSIFLLLEDPTTTKKNPHKPTKPASLTILCHAVTPFTATWHNGILLAHEAYPDSSNTTS